MVFDVTFVVLVGVHHAVVRLLEPHFELVEVQAKQGGASFSNGAQGLELADLCACLMWRSAISYKKHSHWDRLNLRELHGQRLQLWLYWLLALILVEQLGQDLYDAQEFELGAV